MTSRYDTLNVSVNSQANNRKRLNKTIQVTSQRQEEEESSKPQNDNEEKVNKFKELYFKNEKLRKELKLLNQKLNQKLQKLKLPSVKKKAMSVDLNHNPPSKALQRQLQNAYKQVTMYKKQVEVLKGKQQTPQNYEKLRNTENMISYMDMQINKVQEQLKSIKNVKKLQEKVFTQDVQNAELKQRLIDYQKEVKAFKEKLKDIEKKSKNREQQFKKQQAYLVAIETKLRQDQAEEKEQEKPEAQKPKEASEQQFKAIKEQIHWSKALNQQLRKKIQQMRKTIKNTRQQKYLFDQSLRQKQNQHKQLVIQVQSFTRLLKDLQIKRYEQTGVKPPEQIKGNSKFLKLQEIEDQIQRSSKSETRNKQQDLSKFNTFLSSPSNSQNIIPPNNKDERQWKGKMRKLSMGYTIPTDQIFQESGPIIGLKAFFDENGLMSGILAIMQSNGLKSESRVFGTASSHQQKWQCPQGQQLSRITGSFTEQGYLSQIIIITKTGMGVKLGNTQTDQFQFNLEQNEIFSGIFGGIRRLGQDTRITEIGFWASKL